MLIDLLPECVKLGGVEYPLNTDFRTSILFELMMDDPEVPEDRKVTRALALYYPDPIPPELLNEAVDGILWFYQGGKNEGRQKRQTEDGEEPQAEQKRIYSFDYDDDYIYSAFLSQYGLDLQDIEYLHWWKFKAMFKALDDECQFCKIMGYRSTKITSKMSKEQKAFYRHMKAIHALPVPQEEQERQDAIAQALLNGGDLSGLLG